MKNTSGKGSLHDAGMHNPYERGQSQSCWIARAIYSRKGVRSCFRSCRVYPSSHESERAAPHICSVCEEHLDTASGRTGYLEGIGLSALQSVATQEPDSQVHNGLSPTRQETHTFRFQDQQLQHVVNMAPEVLWCLTLAVVSDVFRWCCVMWELHNGSPLIAYKKLPALDAFDVVLLTLAPTKTKEYYGVDYLRWAPDVRRGLQAQGHLQKYTGDVSPRRLRPSRSTAVDEVVPGTLCIRSRKVRGEIDTILIILKA
ncbi:hypothetical protein XENOCAPTIV_020531 [Xenoophorus captivus]|uniref:Uncharacterized protein n=1 Tax=Xenoophorus captivus TaxID=1517983 RepID=A0ABV0Q5L5_9TELE